MTAQVQTVPSIVDVVSPTSLTQGLKLDTEYFDDSSQGGLLDISKNEDESALDFEGLPPFPTNVPVAPLLRISLRKLLIGDQDEVNRLWKACCELGFFYLDMRDGQNLGSHGMKSPERDELTENIWATEKAQPEDHVISPRQQEQDIDGDQLVKDAYALFEVGEQIFDLPVEEKIKYDFKDQGSYFGYKGYGDGVIDVEGTQDRNEFYNVSKDDICGISNRLPAPELLNPHRDLLESYIRHSHAVVTLILRLLNARLDLPPEKLPSLHKLHAVSGDQVRWVYAPPQPQDDRKTALGEHTDFGSVTLLFNRLGGLQVLPPHSEEWCYVKPLQGHAVVNLGDAMVKLTAGVLRSNIHRVVNPPGEQADSTRMSLVYFARPEDDVVLKPLDGSKLIESHKCKTVSFKGEEEITSKEWIKRRALGRRQGGDWQKSGGTESSRLAT